MKKNKNQQVKGLRIVELPTLVEKEKIVYSPRPVFVDKEVVVEKEVIPERFKRFNTSLKLTNFDECFVDSTDETLKIITGTLLDYDSNEYTFEWDSARQKLISLSGTIEHPDDAVLWSSKWQLAEVIVTEKLYRKQKTAPTSNVTLNGQKSTPTKLPPEVAKNAKIPESKEVSEYSKSLADELGTGSVNFSPVNGTVEVPGASAPEGYRFPQARSVKRAKAITAELGNNLGALPEIPDDMGKGLGDEPSDPDNEEIKQLLVMQAALADPDLASEASQRGFSKNKLEQLSQTSFISGDDEDDEVDDNSPLKVGEYVTVKGEMRWDNKDPQDPKEYEIPSGIIGTIVEIKDGAVILDTGTVKETVSLGELRRV